MFLTWARIKTSLICTRYNRVQRCVLWPINGSLGRAVWSTPRHATALRTSHHGEEWSRPKCQELHISSRYLSPEGSSSGTPPQQQIATTLTEQEFEVVCEATLDSLTEVFEDMSEDHFTTEDYDVNFASGVITVQLGEGKGTYVINKQTPNKQIWLSSPVSGPKRYDYIGGAWVYKHDGVTLQDLLTTELSQTFSRAIDFTGCSYSGREGS